MMRDKVNQIRQAVSAWAGVSVQPHRFGGLEFNLGAVEVGHVHWNGMVDIPFNSKIRQQLVTEGRAEPHHLYPETGWITFYIHTDADVEQAIWLFHLSYLFNASRGQGRAAIHDPINLPAEVDELHPSPELRAVFESLTHSAPVVGK